MPRGRKKSVESMKAELEALTRAIEMRERDQKLTQLTSTREFKAVAKEVNRLGLTGAEIAELFQRPKETGRRRKTTKKKGTKLKPKYQNPNNPEQTWTGRGNRPRWVVSALESGMTLDDLRIKEE